MGYFPKKLSRSRWAAEIDEAVQRQADAPNDVWYELENADSQCASLSDVPTFLRFTVGVLDEESHQAQGIFRADLGEKDWPTYEIEAINDSIGWFADNLHAPQLPHPRAIFWFKA